MLDSSLLNNLLECCEILSCPPQRETMGDGQLVLHLEWWDKIPCLFPGHEERVGVFGRLFEEGRDAWIEFFAFPEEDRTFLCWTSGYFEGYFLGRYCLRLQVDDEGVSVRAGDHASYVQLNQGLQAAAEEVRQMQESLLALTSWGVIRLLGRHLGVQMEASEVQVVCH